MYLVSHSVLCHCLVKQHSRNDEKKKKKKKKKKDFQMSVYQKADPGELIQWVTHESRSSAASNSGLIRIGTQPRTADAWHHDSCRPRGVVTRDFSAIFDRLFDRLPVRISTSDLHHWILRKKLYHIRAYDFGVQFSFKALECRFYQSCPNMKSDQTAMANSAKKKTFSDRLKGKEAREKRKGMEREASVETETIAVWVRVYVRPGNGSISHSGSRPDNGSKISKFGIFALLTSSCWWYSKVDLLYILGSMFVTLLDENCMFATHNSLMICMNCWASFERRERSRFSEACIGPG